MLIFYYGRDFRPHLAPVSVSLTCPDRPLKARSSLASIVAPLFARSSALAQDSLAACSNLLTSFQEAKIKTKTFVLVFILSPAEKRLFPPQSLVVTRSFVVQGWRPICHPAYRPTLATPRSADLRLNTLPTVRIPF